MKYIFFLLFVFSIYGQDLDFSELGTGYIPEPIEQTLSIKEVSLNRANQKNLPFLIDLSKQMPPSGSQGKQNSSVAWAVVYSLKSYQEKIERKDRLDWDLKIGEMPNYKNIFSPAFLYNSINDGKDSGITIVEAMQFVIENGAVPWDMMPYISNVYKKKPSIDLYKFGQKFKSKEIQRVKFAELNDVKQLLANGIPIVIGIIVQDNFKTLKADQIYNQPSGNVFGGLSVTLVGYDDNRKCFKFLNSWSDKWGDNGYGYIDYKLFPKITRSAYILIDEIDKENKTPEELESNYPDNLSKILKAPEEITASMGTYSNMVLVSWNKVKNAIGYEIYRINRQDGQEILVGLSGTYQFEDYGVESNVAYKYKVKAIFEDGTGKMSESFIYGYAMSAPSEVPARVINLNASKGDYSDKIVLNWLSVDPNCTYQIYKWQEDSKNYKPIAIVSNTVYEDKKVNRNSGTETYTVASIQNNKIGLASEATIGFIATEKKPSQPENVHASKGLYGNKITIRWKRVANATLYSIYRFSNKKWEKIGAVSGTAFEDFGSEKGLPIGKVYYTIIAQNNEGKWSNFSDYAEGYIDPKITRGTNKIPWPENIQASYNKTSNQIKLTWNPATLADEYSIWMRRLDEKEYKLIQKISNKYTSFEMLLPEKDKFYLFTVTAITSIGSESDKPFPTTVVHSNLVYAPIYRAFGDQSQLEKFKGYWSAMDWDGGLSYKMLYFQIQTDIDNKNYTLTIDKNTKYSGVYIQNLPYIDIQGKMKIELSKNESSLIIQFNDTSIVSKKSLIPFLKE